MDSKTLHSVITPDEMSLEFNIGIKKAKDVFRVTTQKRIGHSLNPLHLNIEFIK